MEYIKDLAGHSGCKIGLYKLGSAYFVRKQAGSANYNIRLKRQFIKQRKFTLQDIKSPQIYNWGKENGLFYFDMEYIEGISLAKYMHSIKTKEIFYLLKVLFNSLQIANNTTKNNTDDIFKTKIHSLQHNPKLTNLACVGVDKLKEFNFSLIPSSNCCGDLTLENILLSPSGVYVIDLLDSFYNSWMIDVAKLLQDLDLKWSYRNIEIDYSLSLRLAVAKQSLIENILELADGKEKLYSIYHILLLNILRIYPYANDQKTVVWLDGACQKVLTTLQNMEKR